MRYYTVLALLPVFFCFGMCFAIASSTPLPSTSSDPVAEIRALFAATKYTDIVSLVSRWRVTFPQAERKQLLLLLLRQLGSDKKLLLEHPERVIVSSTRKQGPVEGKDHVVVRQDVFTEGGRAAWTVEQLLGCQLPVISAALSAEEKQNQVREAYEIVVEALFLPPGLLNAKERATLAASGHVEEQLLATLSSDSNVAVRRAVAANRRTSAELLLQLCRDPDPQVRDAAAHNYWWPGSLMDKDLFP